MSATTSAAHTPAVQYQTLTYLATPKTRCVIFKSWVVENFLNFTPPLLTCMSSSSDAAIFHSQFSPPSSYAGESTVLFSADGIYYSIPSFILRDSTSFFPELLGCKTPIPLMISSKVLTPLMLLLSGLPVAHPLPFAILEEAVIQLKMWGAPGPLAILQGSLTSCVTLPNIPNTSLIIQSFGLAMRVGWQAEAEFIARHTLDVDIWSDKHASDLTKLSSDALLRMMKVRRDRRDKLSNAIRRYSFGIPSKQSPIGPRTQDVAEVEVEEHRCEDPAMATLVEQLFTKIFWEMDKRPSGNTLAQALTKDEWPEAIACWKLKCSECGKDMIDKISFVMQVRQELSKLPVL
jgi:hypothetical protein